MRKGLYGLFAAAVLVVTSCSDSGFDLARTEIRPGQQLSELIEGSVGLYLERQGMKTFSGARDGHAVRCLPTGQPTEWLEAEDPAVSIQSTSEGFYLFLSTWNPGCSGYGCRETLQSLGPVERDELVAVLAKAGCVLSEGMEFRLESPPKTFPPMTYDHFLIRFDERGEVSEVIDG